MNWFSRDRRPAWEPIETDATGFRVGARRVEWMEIASVAAFKRDLFAVDQVWFQIEGAGDPVLVCEDQPGFAAWVAALERTLPSVQGWEARVVPPAFATNFTVLFRRA